jgi:hypothetical protein
MGTFVERSERRRPRRAPLIDLRKHRLARGSGASDRPDRCEGLRRVVTGLEGRMGDLDLVEVGASLVRRAGQLAKLLALRGNDAVHLGSAEALADVNAGV